MEKPLSRETKIVIWVSVLGIIVAIVIGLSAFFVPEVRQALGLEGNQIPPLIRTGAVPPSVPIVKTPSSATLRDNSVHVGGKARVSQSNTGDCSPNIIGGANTVNCGHSLSVPPGIVVEGENGTLDNIRVINGSIEAKKSAKNLTMENVTVDNHEWLEYLLKLAARKEGVLGEIARRRQELRARCKENETDECRTSDAWLDDIEERVKAADRDSDETSRVLREFEDLAPPFSSSPKTP